MVDQTFVGRRDAEDKLATTRRELIDLLRHESEASLAEEHSFPRSRTMRLLVGAGGARALAVVAGGLLISRPALIWRLLRMVPLRAVTRTLMAALASRAAQSR